VNKVQTATTASKLPDLAPDEIGTNFLWPDQEQTNDWPEVEEQNSLTKVEVGNLAPALSLSRLGNQQ
jgi:hypothetical protein